MVYLGALADGDYRVHALDAMSVEQVWVAEAPYPFGAEFTVTIAGGKLYTFCEFGECWQPAKMAQCETREIRGRIGVS